CYQYLSGYTF
nr:immunoglobulin light chain junction region [Macaca mulatta]